MSERSTHISLTDIALLGPLDSSILAPPSRRTLTHFTFDLGCSSRRTAFGRPAGRGGETATWFPPMHSPDSPPLLRQVCACVCVCVCVRVSVSVQTIRYPHQRHGERADGLLSTFGRSDETSAAQLTITCVCFC